MSIESVGNSINGSNMWVTSELSNGYKKKKKLNYVRFAECGNMHIKKLQVSQLSCQRSEVIKRIKMPFWYLEFWSLRCLKQKKFHFMFPQKMGGGGF